MFKHWEFKLMEFITDEDIELSSNALPYDDLLSYLSQQVITITNDKAKIEKKNGDSLKEKLKTLGVQLKDTQNKLSTLESEFSRQKALERVLKIISSLQREGLLIGQNKNKVLTLLKDLGNKDFESCRKLEEALIRYLPS